MKYVYRKIIGIVNTFDLEIMKNIPVLDPSESPPPPPAEKVNKINKKQTFGIMSLSVCM